MDFSTFHTPYDEKWCFYAPFHFELTDIVYDGKILWKFFVSFTDGSDSDVNYSYFLCSSSAIFSYVHLDLQK